jgi:hypothetical protein
MSDGMEAVLLSGPAARDAMKIEMTEQQRALFIAVEDVLQKHCATFDDLCDTYAQAFDDDAASCGTGDNIVRELLQTAAEHLRTAGMDWYVSTK